MERTNLRRASSLLHSSNPRPVVVPLEEEPFERPGLQIPPVQPRKFLMGWRAVTAVELAALTAVLVGGATAPSLWDTPPDTRCVGGDRPVAADGQNKRVEVRPMEWYQDVLRRIKKQNGQAEKYAKDRAVRTVVLFESDPPTDAVDTIFDGAIPELRGVALWQQQLIDDAASDSSRVPLRVEVRPVGAGFQRVVPAVRDLIQEVKREDSGEEYEKVVGVLGFAQSTKETQEAVALLGGSGMPMVGTTATADEMQRSENYWPFTPDNSEEARVEAAFAARSHIVVKAGRTEPNAPMECAPARNAVIVRTPATSTARASPTSSTSPSGATGPSSTSARERSPSPRPRAPRSRPRRTSWSARCARPSGPSRTPPSSGPRGPGTSPPSSAPWTPTGPAPRRASPYSAATS